MKAFIFILCCLGFSHQAEWSYDNQDQWPGVCTTGTLQSPINIPTALAIVDYYQVNIKSPLVFSGYTSVTTTAQNTGHALQWNVVPGTPAPVLSGGPLVGNYTLSQFHLHWISEHAINGNKYSLEVHLVHVKTGLTLEEALTRPDGLAVIGVFGVIQSGPGADYAFAEIAPSVPELVNPGSQTGAKVIDISRLLGPRPQSFYTYQGSLTTPNCDEAVIWIVTDYPLAITQSQYDLFVSVDLNGHSTNFRRLQPIGGRVIYRSTTF